MLQNDDDDDKNNQYYRVYHNYNRIIINSDGCCVAKGIQNKTNNDRQRKNEDSIEGQRERERELR